MILLPFSVVFVLRYSLDLLGRGLFMEFLRKQKYSETHLFFHTMRLWKQKICLFFLLAAYLPIGSSLLRSFRGVTDDTAQKAFLKYTLLVLSAAWLIFGPILLFFQSWERFKAVQKNKEKKKREEREAKKPSKMREGRETRKGMTDANVLRQGVSFIEVEKLYMEKKKLKLMLGHKRTRNSVAEFASKILVYLTGLATRNDKDLDKVMEGSISRSK